MAAGSVPINEECKDVNPNDLFDIVKSQIVAADSFNKLEHLRLTLQRCLGMIEMEMDVRSITDGELSDGPPNSIIRR